MAKNHVVEAKGDQILEVGSYGGKGKKSHPRIDGEWLLRIFKKKVRALQGSLH